MGLTRRVFISGIAASALLNAKEPGQSGMLGEMRTHGGGIALWWVGNDGWQAQAGREVRDSYWRSALKKAGQT